MNPSGTDLDTAAESGRPTAEPEPSPPTPPNDADGGGSTRLNRVREILFGSRGREAERRLLELEARLLTEIDALRNTVQSLQ
ncbi:MAG: hypothetical protein AAFN74_09920, partial [Myxococcota bacterium]